MAMKRAAVCFFISLVVLITPPRDGIPAPGNGDILLGATWNTSRLVSFDPETGVVTEVHAQLNPYESFRGLAYDANHDVLYALSQVENNLYRIDPMTVEIAHIGNLHIDRAVSWGEDAGALAYDPVGDILYTVVDHWSSDHQAYWSELCTIDVDSAELTIVGEIQGAHVSSLAYNEDDGELYGLALLEWCGGSWDSPCMSHVVRLDPETAELDVLFETPYHTMLGFAKRPGFDRYYSWINTTSHLYGETDLDGETVSFLGDADAVGVVSALLCGDFSVGSVPLEVEPERVSFDLPGRVTGVWDPDRLLQGRVAVGNSLSLGFSYDATAPYKMPDPNREPPYGIVALINGLVFTSEGLMARVQNNYYDAGRGDVSDRFWLSSLEERTTFPVPMPEQEISWRLMDSSAAVLSHNNLLPTRFDFSDWSGNEFLIHAGMVGEGVGYVIHGVVDGSGGGGMGSSSGGGGGCFVTTATSGF